jgi:alkylation response protein AidB-like acyl-CoA dehydrogenase
MKCPPGDLSDAAPGHQALTAVGLIAAFGRHRAEFETAGDQAETLRTLPLETVETLKNLGVFWLKSPSELGGTPVDPLSFCDVIEELAYIDVSVAWTAMIGASGTGVAGGWLPEEGVRRVFAAGRPPPVVAGQLSPRGIGISVDGGYLVSGHWGFSSGILHADWLIGMFATDAGTSLPGRETTSKRMIVFAIPREQAEVIDNWHVVGLRGSGSLDWKVSGLFVPAELTYSVGAPAVRGSDLFRLGMPAFTSNEVPPLCLGLARRALDDMIELSTGTARFPDGPLVSERAVFLKELGRAEVKVRAARLLHRDAMAAMWETARAGATPPKEQHVAGTVASVYAVETCTEVVTDLFRYGGAQVLAPPNPMQRHLRNVLAARQHVGMSEETYEAAGLLRLQSVTHRKMTAAHSGASDGRHHGRG